MKPTPEGPSLCADTAWTATGHEPPVFLDARGRRRRWVLLGGVLTGAASTFWLAALVAGSIGVATMPSPQSLPRIAGSRMHLRVTVAHGHDTFADTVTSRYIKCTAAVKDCESGVDARVKAL